MRNLQLHDLFLASAIVDRLGIRSTLKERLGDVLKAETINDDIIQAFGIDVIFDMILKAPEVEGMFYELFGGLFGMEPNQVRELDPMKFMDMLEQLKNHIPTEDWKAFFTRVLDLKK